MFQFSVMIANLIDLILVMCVTTLICWYIFEVGAVYYLIVASYDIYISYSGNLQPRQVIFMYAVLLVLLSGCLNF